ncbi:hypothetical protein [Streptomyces sp. AM 2-1-1]|uniref:hypothetical protein n=1 Tax=Streptomyces sp. AM 2-1-1 TaxID=3028709 RepID=UPI0023B91B30|nr:hypothetical protein [Streptomyces sp. AM 2-1-1]WEH38154.1 hypothetical protein PZB77_00760 [Streptomyces sp. AM 2-1-1]
MTRTEHSVFALSPDKNGVHHFHDGAWIRVGGPADRLFGGGGGLVATSPGGGDVHRYLNTPDTWERIGGPGATFAVTRGGIFGLAPDRSGVYAYTGSSGSWTRIGGPASEIYGGGWGLVATGPGSGDLFHYLGSPDTWVRIGEPGVTFAVTDESVYGLSANPVGGGVYRYDGQGTSWTRIGGPAGRIYGGGWGLAATDPVSGDLFGFQYVGPEDDPEISPGTWRQVGGPGAAFSVGYETIFGLSTNPVGGGVYRYDGQGTSWTRIGGPADSLTAALWWST